MKTKRPLLASLFASTALASPPSPLLYYPSWKYEGCITSTGAPERILRGFAPSDPNTEGNAVEDCLGACGSGYAALASGSCYCADSINGIAPYAVRDDSECDFPCASDPEESCGGSINPKNRIVGAISLYSYSRKGNSSVTASAGDFTTQAGGPTSLPTTMGLKLPDMDLNSMTTASGLHIATTAAVYEATGSAARELDLRSLAAVSFGLLAVAAAFLMGS